VTSWTTRWSYARDLRPELRIPDPPPELRPLAVRYRAGEYLAVLVFLMIVVGAVASALDATHLLVVLRPLAAATAVVAAVLLVPSYLGMRRLAREYEERQKGGSGGERG
jgi:hypothetical protein